MGQGKVAVKNKKKPRAQNTGQKTFISIGLN